MQLTSGASMISRHIINAAYWNNSTSGYYPPLSSASTSEGTSLTASSYTTWYVVPYDGRVVRIASMHQRLNARTTTLEMYIDGDDSDLVADQRGTDLSIGSHTQKFQSDCPSDWTFSKGEGIAIRRTDSVSTYGCGMTIVLEFDLSS